jgi:PAS domain S-box-containing protein
MADHSPLAAISSELGTGANSGVERPACFTFESVLRDPGPSVEPPARCGELSGGDQLLRDTEAALHGVLDAAQIGVWECDLSTRRLARSAAHDEIHGYPPTAEWTFDTFLDRVAPEHRAAVGNHIDKCLLTGAGEVECRIIRADGSPAWISWRGRVVRDAAGTPLQIVGIVVDVTRRRLAEQALALERRRKETFISTLAHELRQPLSALLAAAEVMRLASDSAAANRASEVMKRQIGQMNRVVEDLMDATRWAQGKLTLRKQRVDVRDVINDALPDVTAAAAECGHELVVATASEPLWADADPQRLQQVLSNLFRNAVKYTARGGRISLAADRGAATVILRISDSGRGIDPEALPHVFDLFSQVRPAEAAGLGIGLSVVREIVALHDGQIEARSEGLGQGSEFIVTLPMASPPPST